MLEGGGAAVGGTVRERSCRPGNSRAAVWLTIATRISIGVRSDSGVKPSIHLRPALMKPV